MYNVFTQNGYIVSIAKDQHGNVTDEEYQRIKAALRDRPTPPDGYDYRLTADLEWEMFELPKETNEPETDDEDATEADYLASLAELGVSE